jgi:hypothetical protein
MDRLKLLILGHGRHGKDTVGDMIAEKFTLKSISSSLFAAKEAVFPIMELTHGYKTVEECYEDRGNHRELWYRLISMYNTPDKSRLVRGLLKDHDIYVGLRCSEEYQAAKQYFDAVLWVDAHKRFPAEPSMKIEFEDDMIWVDNNGTLEDLQAEIERVCSEELYDC